MEKTIKIKIPEGYNDAVFDKETNEIKFIKSPKLGDKITIDGIEGYVLEVDDTGKPTMLCSKFLGEMSWNAAMKKANQGIWHLPTTDEWKKYYKVVREIDSDRYTYWTSTVFNPLHAHYVYTPNGYISPHTKAGSNYVRAFAYVGEKKDSKPRSWEEYREQVHNTPCFTIGIASMAGYVIEGNRRVLPYVNEVNTEEEAKAVVALCKLIQLRDAWWGDWKPDWESTNQPKYFIYFYKDNLAVCMNYNARRILSFPTPEMRDEFLGTFRSLIKEAKPLL